MNTRPGSRSAAPCPSRAALRRFARVAIACCAPALLAAPLGCRTIQPLDEHAIASDPLAADARTRVAAVMTMARVDGADATWKASGFGSATLLDPTHLLTSAHVVPDGLLAAPIELHDDEGNVIFEGVAALGDFAVHFAGGATTTAVTVASGEYTPTPRGSMHQSRSWHDWAIVRLNTPATNAVETIEATATPIRGERCVVVGFAGEYLPHNGVLFTRDPDREPGGGRSIGVEDVALPRTPLVFEGTIEHVADDHIKIRFDAWRTRGFHGISGGGVFVERDGRAAFVGVPAQGVSIPPLIYACPTPPAALDHLARGG